MAKKKSIVSPEEQIQNVIASTVVDSEYRTAQNLHQLENAEFDTLIDIIEGRRVDKNYEWMSNQSIPEFLSILLTDASQWSGQYFQTRDFVEVKLDGDTPGDDRKAVAAKKCINKTLNDRDLHYYMKYMRLRLLNSLSGTCYAVCRWEQEIVTETKTVHKLKRLNTDIHGQPITTPEQIPGIGLEAVNEDHTRPITDRFNFDVVDPRNIFTDSKYTYSIQEKDWVIIRTETSYDKLKENEKRNNYFNLDKVKDAIKARQQSDTARETYAKEDQGFIDKTPVHYFDMLDRYGKFWAVIEEKDERDNAIKIKPGVGTDGFPLDEAELIQALITFVVIGSHKIMIGFEPTPYLDALKKPYYPIARGWCYIHPTKDKGLSDGRNAKDLQAAIDDTYNMSSDRVKLATLPVFKGKKSSLEGNGSIYLEPEHVIELEDVNDLEELVIKDNVQGALEQLAMLTGKMQQVTATYPTTMGALPDKASTTATAVVGSDNRSNARANYKSLTFEFTFLQEFYWIILQMTSRFAHDDTLMSMLGPDAMYFDANADYTYTPLTQSIETEYNKYKKIQLYDQTIGRLSNLVQMLPAVVPIIARMIGKQMVLQGDEFPEIGADIMALAKSKPVPEASQGTQPAGMGAAPVSNQNGVPMSNQEQEMRGMAPAS